MLQQCRTLHIGGSIGMTAPARTIKMYLAVGVPSPPRYNQHLAGLLGRSIVDLDGRLLTVRNWTNQSGRGRGATVDACEEMKPVA